MTNAFVLGSVRTDDSTIIVSGAANCDAGGDYDTFESPVGTAIQVTAGKTLIVGRVRFESPNAGASFFFGYADDAIVSAAGPPTNPVILSEALFTVSATINITFNVLFKVPEGKFPFALIAGAATGIISIEGIEV